jgi:hypothetical protein
MLMTCQYSGCERTLRRIQPLSINSNQLTTRHSLTSAIQRAAIFLKKLDITLGQEHKNSLPCPRRGEGKKGRKKETREKGTR